LRHDLFMAEDVMTMTERLAAWGRGAHALALLNAVNDRGWTTFLSEPRDLAAVAAFSGLPPERTGDVLYALVEHGVAEETDGRFRLAPAYAAALSDDAFVDLGAVIAYDALIARQVEDVVRTGTAPLREGDALTVALAVGLRPNPAAAAVVARLFEPLPEMWSAMRSGRLLDVGSGIGGFVMTAATLLPELRATTLELEPEVAAVAAERARALGVDDRIDVRTMDARDFDEPSAFDAANWAQPFFPESTRSATLAMIWRSLRPGGLMMIQEMESEPADLTQRPAFTLRRLVARARDMPFARPIADLVAEAAVAGFEPVRQVDSDFGQLALVRRPAS
jgi:SAM-dependent methyltransferase